MNTNVYKGGGNGSICVFFNSGVLFCFTGVSVVVDVVCLVLSCLFGFGSWFFRDPQFSFVSICCRVSPQGCVTISWNRKCLIIIPSRHPLTPAAHDFSFWQLLRSPLPFPDVPPHLSSSSSLLCHSFASSLWPALLLSLFLCIWAGFPASQQVCNSTMCRPLLNLLHWSSPAASEIPGRSTTDKAQSDWYLSSHHLSFISSPCQSTEYCMVNTITNTFKEKSGRITAWRCFRNGVAWDADGELGYLPS